jgi:hypothetical protein
MSLEGELTASLQVVSAQNHEYSDGYGNSSFDTTVANYS